MKYATFKNFCHNLDAAAEAPPKWMPYVRRHGSRVRKSSFQLPYLRIYGLGLRRSATVTMGVYVEDILVAHNNYLLG